MRSNTSSLTRGNEFESTKVSQHPYGICKIAKKKQKKLEANKRLSL